MAAKKKKGDEKYTLIVDSPEGNAGVTEDIEQEEEKPKEYTLAEKQTLALARFTDDEKKTAPKLDDKEEKEAPPIPLDVSWCVPYAKSYGLSISVNNSGKVFVATLTDPVTGHEVVGYDAQHRPHTFGLTKERAILNAIEFHKRMVPPIAEGAFEIKKVGAIEFDSEQFKEDNKYPPGQDLVYPATAPAKLTLAQEKERDEMIGAHNILGLKRAASAAKQPLELPIVSPHEMALIKALREFVRVEIHKQPSQVSEVKEALKELLTRLG